ncbi:hypothetical protein GA0061105_12026 [Rhizobium aethiopicum]|uniref:Uncharacterized protein n=1 Tax=Rhizobium aethiopicum TaxID=1138170 RepID=A0A1C3YAN2_9HYPH|nr:SyrB2 regulator [Rhizobium aethiopicum]SCB61582.1 hypothetical protein GA0061105_12026 [Rhizobium aethiopicum]
MAEENIAGPVAGGPETDAPIKADVKKKRAPRRQKQAAEPAPATEAVTELLPAADAGKPVRRGRGRKPRSIETKASDGKTALKGRARNKTAKPAEQTAKASAPVIDELEDLLQLEEENKRLRKLLAEKLRQENTDLRKRLGLA